MPEPLEPMSLAALLGGQRVLPLVEVDDTARAIELARVLVDHGLPVVEIALRTPAAVAAIAAARSSVADAVVGAGTVLSPAQLDEATGAGAAFAVSPGWSPELLSAATAGSIPFVPGIATVTELMHVAESGVREVKFFHAEASGGPSALAAMASVMPSMRFLPTGGIHADSAPAYLALEQVFAVGGSWVCPAGLIRERAWSEIGERARVAASLTKPRPA